MCLLGFLDNSYWGMARVLPSGIVRSAVPLHMCVRSFDRVCQNIAAFLYRYMGGLPSSFDKLGQSDTQLECAGPPRQICTHGPEP